MKHPKIKKGDVFHTRNGGMCTVVQYNGAFDVVVTFEPTYPYTTTVRAEHLRRGAIANPYYPTVYGKGFIGEGPHRYHNGRKKTFVGVVWAGILARLFDSTNHVHNPTYTDCTIAPEWLNFQVFAEWHSSQNKPEDWAIDKDILFRGNREYSAETCRLVPKCINNLFTSTNSRRGDLPIGVSKKGCNFVATLQRDGVSYNLGTHKTPLQAFVAYKVAKEENIQRIAHLYVHELDPELYKAMLDYRVRFDD